MHAADEHSALPVREWRAVSAALGSRVVSLATSAKPTAEAGRGRDSGFPDTSSPGTALKDDGAG
jgi:hypothetical protein